MINGLKSSIFPRGGHSHSDWAGYSSVLKSCAVSGVIATNIEFYDIDRPRSTLFLSEV